jgi:heavy-metal-associated domain-containing protein
VTNHRWIAVAHHLPDRTRLRSPLLRRDRSACEKLADALAAFPGVREVACRPYTGSALVHHKPDLALDKLVAEVQRVLDVAKVLAPGEPPPIDPDVPAFSSLARTLVAAVRAIDSDIRRGSDGTVDLGTLATFGLLGAGAVEVAATGKLPLPPWFNLAWWGFRTFVTTEQAEIRAEQDK